MKEVSAREKAVVTSYSDDNMVVIRKAGRKGAVLKSELGASNEYQFDNVFGPESTQKEVYDATAKLSVQATLEGVNCTVFAYGATGAGKTHSMLGNDTEPGIIPRALVDVFKGIRGLNNQENKNQTWQVKISYLEVYNETIYDLLSSTQKALQPCEDPVDSRVKVLGLTEEYVGDVGDVLKLLNEGNSRRRMESTAANQVSSRSHAVMQVNLECTEVTPATGRGLRATPRQKSVRTSTLSLIDLAGSERAAATKNTGIRLREGANINKSLLALANCINALSLRGDKRAARVKYRDSKLTHLLKSSLEGSCMLSMIAAINPSDKCYEESHNTLKYANRAKNIKVQAVAVKRVVLHTQEAHKIESLQAENQELRSRLSNFSENTTSDIEYPAISVSPPAPPSQSYGFESTASDRMEDDEDVADVSADYESKLAQLRLENGRAKVEIDHLREVIRAQDNTILKLKQGGLNSNENVAQNEQVSLAGGKSKRRKSFLPVPAAYNRPVKRLSLEEDASKRMAPLAGSPFSRSSIASTQSSSRKQRSSRLRK